MNKVSSYRTKQELEQLALEVTVDNQKLQLDKLQQEAISADVTMANLKRQRNILKEACEEFVRKVECGEAKSVASYAQMKAALELIHD